MFSVEESFDQVIENNTVSCIVMSMMSHPMDVTICSHGARALEWIIKTGGSSVSKLLIDEGVFDVCIDVIQNHDDIELISSVSFLLIKIVKASSKNKEYCFYSIEFDEYSISSLCETTLFSVLKERMELYEKNESLATSYCNIIAVLVSNRMYIISLFIRTMFIHGT